MKEIKQKLVLKLIKVKKGSGVFLSYSQILMSRALAGCVWKVCQREPEEATRSHYSWFAGLTVEQKKDSRPLFQND
jgi:hypothetical protein